MHRVLQSKFRAFMNNPVRLIALLLPLVLWNGVAHAEKADRNKPMNIEADALRYDDVKQVSIFTGRVVLTKGTIMIRGNQVEVRQDPEGYQFGLVTGTPDSPAFFKQKREGVDETIEGEALTIDYDGKADVVKFIKNAQVRRYRGTALGDEITGGTIVYDNLSDKFTVDGGQTKTAVGLPQGRVRVMLTPKSDAATDAKPGTNGVTLRASPAMEGSSK